jgi:DNA mismatch repair protein MutL
VWGSDLAGTLIPVRFASGGFRVEGFVQRPGDAKPTGRRTQLFINGRPFRDPFLIRAAESGYRSAIHPGDRPSLFLHLETAADAVDVNVHPAKLEVRFRERLGAERAVEEAVRDALGKWGAIVPVGEWRPGPGVATGTNGHWTADAGGALSTELPADLATELFAPLGAPETDPRATFAAPLNQLFDSYLVYQAAEGLVFVDQHSAHERVLYEEVMARIRSGDMPAQRLLLPLMLELTDEELEAVEAHREMLSLVGFEVEPFGGRTLAVQAVPSPHPRFDAGRCFRELVSDLARGRFGGWANPLERFAATYACHAAVKAGDPLDPREQRELMTRLLGCSLPAHDVHGRATIVQLPREELERRFGRR